MGKKPKEEKRENHVLTFFDRLSDGCLVFGCISPVVFLITPVLIWIM
ncbi:hypothetical protein VBD025_14385 [Virgibacillus flavescens]